ncbi:acetoacetate--CoA ligase [Roseospira visakhapatnamensis]|uniref:Acetoacetyl-CoA synthetase n=1 Tax=Roseospira visakhapatnamensis TaxID=390880 RepID=A0A7W6RB97_9PROT|nr:acetoacetate--CoA ligase [Roseospira visakhapatnamensis]MBB4265314.1 acetoacetyl-CoA synthetase [Roseospira visakhapatnamensis]
MTEPLWSPSEAGIRASTMMAFMDQVNQAHGLSLSDYDSLYQWSIDQPAAFWSAVWDFCGLIGEKGAVVVDDVSRMPGARWFPEGSINMARNLLRPDWDRDADALVFWGETHVRRRLTFGELWDQVSRVQQALIARGVAKGDRVAGYIPNMPETVITMLACAGIGAIWSSASPDFGVQGVVDRFGQIEPKVLVAAEGYFYNGKAHDCLEKTAAIVERMPSVETVVIIPYTRADADLSGVRGAVAWDDLIAPYTAGDIRFDPLPFDHPLYIMYSSGTTGVPKCIVHGHGGTLIQQVKEHVLHCDIKPGDRVFYFTTCGWMMWNWLMAGLAARATLLLYDGSPGYPSGAILFDYADAEGMTHFGTSAKWIDAIRKADLKPRETHSLATVRVMTSTGSPLVPESFDYVYRDIKSDIQLSSISGGTDILSCFMLGSPITPVHRGEIQKRGLGMKTEVYDESGHPVSGAKGELVCTQAFPSTPIGFWNDPDDAKFRAAYFERFPGIWTHGDWVELTDTGGLVVYGRSDATLNPGGVRIGTAEIYRQVELLDEVVEALVIGQEWDNDVRVVLFVRLRDGLTLDEPLAKRIKGQIRQNCTPRHVPAKVVQVADIPRTKSNKIVELAVREVVHGRPVKNIEALANPEALDEFRDRAELTED